MYYALIKEKRFPLSKFFNIFGWKTEAWIWTSNFFPPKSRPSIVKK